LFRLKVVEKGRDLNKKNIKAKLIKEGDIWILLFSFSFCKFFNQRKAIKIFLFSLNFNQTKNIIFFCLPSIKFKPNKET